MLVGAPANGFGGRGEDVQPHAHERAELVEQLQFRDIARVDGGNAFLMPRACLPCSVSESPGAVCGSEARSARGVTIDVLSLPRSAVGPAQCIKGPAASPPLAIGRTLRDVLVPSIMDAYWTRCRG